MKKYSCNNKCVDLKPFNCNCGNCRNKHDCCNDIFTFPPEKHCDPIQNPCENLPKFCHNSRQNNATLLYFLVGYLFGSNQDFPNC